MEDTTIRRKRKLPRWVKVAPQQAKRYSLYGVYGLLAYYGYGLFISYFLLTTISFFNDYPISTKIILFLLFFSWNTARIIGLFKKKKYFLCLSYFWYGFLALGIIADCSLDSENLIATGWVIWWVTYLTISRRVNATFRHKIPVWDLRHVLGPKMVEECFGRFGYTPEEVWAHK